MNNWSKMLKVLEAKGRIAAWQFAKVNFKKGSTDFEAARRFFSPNKQDLVVTAQRQRAINSVSKKEIRDNCQFTGLPVIGK